MCKSLKKCQKKSMMCFIRYNELPNVVARQVKGGVNPNLRYETAKVRKLWK